MSPSDTTTDSFQQYRPRLLAIAYRMLGSRADAEDIVQDAWLRWRDADTASLRSGEAWLVTVATRLCIDRLRSLRNEREHYIGPWLPEPIIEDVADTAPSPEQLVEFAGDVSLAFLKVLERLSPDERAAFLLHEVFDVDYPEIAEMLTRNEAACRQLVSRARARVREDRPRVTVRSDAHQALLARFMAATRSGERTALEALFAADAQFVGDGGGKVLSVLKALHGRERIARFFDMVARQIGHCVDYRPVLVNGEPGLLRYIDGKLDAVFNLISDGEHIVAIFAVRNPDKLARIEEKFCTYTTD